MDKERTKKSVNPKIVFLVLVLSLVALTTMTIIINGFEKRDEPYSPYYPAGRYEQQEVFSFYSDKYEVDDIEITRIGDSITISGNDEVYCVDAPCPEIHYEHSITFSNTYMSEIHRMLDFLNPNNRYQLSVNYDDLSFDYKQIISAMENNDQSKMHRYTLQFWNDDVRYDIKADDESIDVSKYDLNSGRSELYALDFDKENLEQIRIWINQMCSRENEPNVIYGPDEDIFLMPDQKKAMDAVINNDESYLIDDSNTDPKA